ncbi:MAG: bifunctional DNA primase/polymerase [Candidatus Nitrosocosmicus sp.]|nr:bifunctional DNA primase/polymerase [Candidatus Nitrosocosmicus sp.]
MDSLNSNLNYFYHDLGMNIIPVDSRNKKPLVNWKEWQTKTIPIEMFEQWKKEGLFDKGFGIITGRIWRGKYQGYFLICLDCDNEEAIREFLSTFKEIDSLRKLAQHTLIVQHEDAKDKRAHIYMITRTQMSKKCGISANNKNKEKDIDLPTIEVKTDSSTFMIGPGSMHKNGYPYQIQGTRNIQVLDEQKTTLFDDTLNKIYQKYNKNYGKNSSLPTIHEMDEDDYVVYKGNNRHLNLLRKIDSWYSLSNKALTFDELLVRGNNWNMKHCEPLLEENEVSDLVKQSMGWIDKKNNSSSGVKQNFRGYNNEDQKEISNSESVDKEKLFDKILDKNIVEYVINTAQKTIKQENSLTRLILYTALSAYTKEPVNLGIMAPTSEGKTYPVNETIKFLPKQDVWLIGSMSPKVIIRDRGITVDENNNPIDGTIKELRKLIKMEKKEDKKEELIQQLQSLYENSKVLIDLTNKILIFLEPPHQETWDILKPILSHDSEFIEHPYVYKTETGGQAVKHVVTRGWPSCIFCSAKDESNWPTWPEIQSRFFITSPNMIRQKYEESNLLIGQRQGLPSLVQEQLIVSLEEIQQAENCILLIKKELLKNYDNGVWIPYYNIFSQSLPSEKGTDVRLTMRIVSLLKLITKINLFTRFKLKMRNETCRFLLIKTLKKF